MKAVGCRLWAVGRSTRRVRTDFVKSAVARASIWRLEFDTPTRYSLRIKAAASSLLATAYSLQPTAFLRPRASRTELTP